MGREVKSLVTHGGASVEARAHLDGEMVTIGVPVRAKLRISGLKAVVDAEGVVLQTGREVYRIAMSAKEAAAWVKAIENPPSLAEKLGLKAGVTVAVIGEVPGEIEALAEGAARYAAPPARIAAMVTLAAVKALDVKALTKIARALPEKGAVWLVYEKGVMKGDALIFAAREAGLKDTKVARISETHTGLRFIPRC